MNERLCILDVSIALPPKKKATGFLSSTSAVLQRFRATALLTGLGGVRTESNIGFFAEKMYGQGLCEAV
jgi:hypothetical protein